jgi:hypothetical protein
VVNEFDTGIDNSVAGRTTADVLIVVTHVAYVSSMPRDAYPVAPAASDLIGIRSQNTLIGALNDGTVYCSNGTSNRSQLSRSRAGLIPSPHVAHMRGRVGQSVPSTHV